MVVVVVCALELEFYWSFLFARFCLNVSGLCCWCVLIVILAVVFLCALELEFEWLLLSLLLFARFSLKFNGRCCECALNVILMVVVCALELDF